MLNLTNPIDFLRNVWYHIFTKAKEMTVMSKKMKEFLNSVVTNRGMEDPLTIILFTRAERGDTLGRLMTIKRLYELDEFEI